jgi:two-component system sensor histidine kinase/response regulator
MNDHIAKPIDPDVLFATLLHHLLAQPLAAVTHHSSHTASPTEANPAPTADPLDAVQGLVWRDGLKRHLNNRSGYEKMLRRFQTSQADTANTLRQSLAQGDTASAERQAHTLKGIAGTLGAEQLQSYSGVLEMALRQGVPPQDCTAMVQAVEAELHRLLEALHSALPVATQTATPVAFDAESLAAARPLLIQLDALLADFDAEAVTYYEDHAESLRAALGQQAAAFETALNRYDFEAASQLLREIPWSPSPASETP